LYPERFERIVFSAEEISLRVRELGAQITADFNGEPGSPLTLIGMLKGGFVFLADLIRCIGLDLRVDFMAISSYRQTNASSTGVRIIKDLSESIYGRDIIIVEDIVDTGLTLSYIMRNLRERSPRELKVCTLLDRTVSRIAPLHIDYSGFEVGEEYLVGYGLDHLQQWRNLRFICSITGDIHTS
jgi:hypoxanthine phosphoribosyltransferase